jgi:hypothetical protein
MILAPMFCYELNAPLARTDLRQKIGVVDSDSRIQISHPSSQHCPQQWVFFCAIRLSSKFQSHANRLGGQLQPVRDVKGVFCSFVSDELFQCTAGDCLSGARSCYERSAQGTERNVRLGYASLRFEGGRSHRAAWEDGPPFWVCSPSNEVARAKHSLRGSKCGSAAIAEARPRQRSSPLI